MPSVTSAQGSVTVGFPTLTLTAPPPGYRDFLGSQVVAVGSDKLLIGAYLDDAGAVDAGAAYLFSTNGTLLTTFTNPGSGMAGLFRSESRPSAVGKC